MSQYFVRSGGQVFGPYSQQQLSSLAASGRVTPTTEISTDRVNWSPASTLQGGSSGGQQAAAPAAVNPARYLERVRGRTHYPIYRAVVLICSVIGYIGAALISIAHVVMIIRMGLDQYFRMIEGQPWMVVLPFVMSAVVAVLVKFYQELTTMLVDFTDSTIDYHARH